jgi:hypothetical protein
MSSLQTENPEPVKNLAEAIQRLQAIAQADSIARPGEVALLTASALKHIEDRLKVIEDRRRDESKPRPLDIKDAEPSARSQFQKF